MEPSVSAQFQFTDRKQAQSSMVEPRWNPGQQVQSQLPSCPPPQMAWLPLMIGNHLGSLPEGLLGGLGLEVGYCLPLGFLSNPLHSSDLTRL